MMKTSLALMMVVAVTSGMAAMTAAQNVTVTTAPSNATVVVVTSASASPSPSASRTPAAVVVVVSVTPLPTAAGVAKQLSVTVQNTSPASALSSPLRPWLKQLVLADFGLGTFFCS